MQSRVDPIQKQALSLHILLIIGLLGYLLPWAVASSAPMTLNAFDLAEWTSLHPAQRHTAPPLLAPLLLRAQLVILTLIFALTASGRPWRAIAAPAIFLLALAQLPPFEYVYDIANLNYRQQFILALVSLNGGLIANRVGRLRFARILWIGLPIAGIVSLFAGVAQAFGVLRQLQAVASVGLGPWLLIASYVGIAALCLLAFRSSTPNATN